MGLAVISAWERLLGAWDRFGQIPAVYAVVGFYLGMLAVGLTVDDPGGSWLALVPSSSFGLYCFARWDNGMLIFGIAGLPAWAALFAHELLHAPRWVGAALIPVTLWMAWAEDHRSDEAAAGPTLDALQASSEGAPRRSSYRL